MAETHDFNVKELEAKLIVKGYKVIFADSAEAAVEAILGIVGIKESVGAGGSLTLREIKALATLKTRGNSVYDHWQEGVSAADKSALRREAVRADVYLTSTNALTLDGEFVNYDTFGNRAAAMIYGPEKVIIVAGYNKVVKDLEEAEKRITGRTAPANAKRLGVDRADKLLKVKTVIYACPDDTEITVVLIKGKYGI